MKLILAGASGFIGRPLSLFLESQGHTVVPLVRKKKHQNDLLWSELAPQHLRGVDAVLNLSGEPIWSIFWTSAKKKKILESRVDSTKLLVRTILDTNVPPKLFFSASAIGFYGNRGEEKLSEESRAGHGFLPTVCTLWEEATRPLQKRAIRTVQARFGVVLGKEGGILKRLLPFYRRNMGAILGSGKEWISWIHIEDLLLAISFLLKKETIQGAINLTSPNPIQQKEFAKALAQKLGKKVFLRIPPPLLRFLFGEVADELFLASTKAFPVKLQKEGFSFTRPHIEDAFYDL